MTEPRPRVGLLFHPRLPETQRLADELAAVVEAHGAVPWIASAWEGDELAAPARDCALLVTMGGDGTILRVARTTVGHSGGQRQTPPLLTINFGTLGFLSELPPEEAAEGLAGVLAGQGWLEARHLLHAEVERAGQIVAVHEALNEAVLARGDGPHAIRLTLWVDGAETARYTADGMIVATPTGSTAYALGAGGPIMGPTVPALLAIPVAPHLALSRGFVLPASSRLTLEASSYKPMVVTLDGQTTLDYHEGDRLHVTQSEAVARFVRFGPPTHFYATLQDKLRRG